MKDFDGLAIKDISCSYKYCTFLNDKGEIVAWGKYLRSKVKNVEKKKDDEQKVLPF